MKIVAKILILLTLTAGVLFAQGGSVYSRYGVGDINTYQSARQLALGGQGISVASQDYINYLNPASWNKLNVTRMEASFDYRGTVVGNDADSRYYSETTFNGFSIGIPIQRDYGMSLVVGLMPYSNVEYTITDLSTDENNYDLVFAGSGGLTKIYFGFSYRLPFGLSVGASLDYFTGTIENNSTIDFIDNSNINDTYFTSIRKYHGVGFTFGTITNNLAESFGLESISDLRLGASISTQTKITTDTSLVTGIIGGLVTDEDGETKTTLPMKFNLGASLSFNDNYMFQLDYNYQPWEDYSFASSQQDYFSDMHKVSLGVEFFGQDNLYASFKEKIDYRFGLAFEKSHLNIRNQDINQLSVHAGFSVPIGFWSTMDFGFMYGRRGTSDSGLLTEDIYKLSMSLSIGEMWFLRVER